MGFSQIDGLTCPIVNGKGILDRTFIIRRTIHELKTEYPSKRNKPIVSFCKGVEFRIADLSQIKKSKQIVKTHIIF